MKIGIYLKIFTFCARPKHYIVVLSQQRSAVIFQSKFEFARQLKKAYRMTWLLFLKLLIEINDNLFNFSGPFNGLRLSATRDCSTDDFPFAWYWDIVGQPRGANRNATTTTKGKTRLTENFAFCAQKRLSAQKITQEYFS